MNNAPAVFVPTQPESNGLTLPMLLSVLAHGIVIGFLLYNYQHIEIDTAGNLETVMISPEQLSEMQGQILANRAAAADAMQAVDSSSGMISDEPFNPNESTQSSASTAESNSQNVPVFMRSDDLPSQPMLMSDEQHQRRIEQMQEYRRNMEAAAAQFDNEIAEERNQVEQEVRNQFNEEQSRLEELRRKQNNPPKIKKPTSNQRNIEITAGSSGSGGKTMSLSDGSSTISGDMVTSSTATGSSRSASSGSRGSSNSEIVNLIKRNYKPPIAAKGSSQRASLTITVNANGKVISVSASGPDSAVNEAAERAVMSTGSLPIDTDDPKYPTFTVEFRGTN